MKRARLWIVLGLPAAALAAPGAMLLSAGDSSSGAESGGPLAYDEDYYDTLGFTVHVGEPYSWGLVVLRNKGEAPATVRRVTLTGQRGTLEVVGLYVLPESRPQTVGFAPGFDAADGDPVEGLVIPPGEGQGFQVVFGVEVEDEGISGFRSVQVDYDVGSAHYTDSLAHSLALCAPIETYDECPAPTVTDPGSR
jgi:hypothetical protein